MTQKEFEERTGIVPTPEDFEYIHEVYMNTSMDKDAFCKEFKKHGESQIIRDIYIRVVNCNVKLNRQKEVTYAPTLLDLGEKAMIGKGKRSKEVIDAIVRNHAVYFAAVGGAGALLSKCITKSEIVCYEDLGAEAIRKIEIKDFPVIVVIDSQGDNLYETAVKEFAG